LISHLVAEYIFHDFAEAIELTPKLVRILGERQEAGVAEQKSSSQSLRSVSCNSDPQINTERDRLNEIVKMKSAGRGINILHRSNPLQVIPNLFAAPPVLPEPGGLAWLTKLD
jgi:hypothetical protein